MEKISGIENVMMKFGRKMSGKENRSLIIKLVGASSSLNRLERNGGKSEIDAYL